VSVEVWRKYWTQFNWLEELFYLAILATEACVIYPWQVLVSRLFQYDGLPLWGLCILLWVPYFVSGLLNRTELSTDRKQALVAGLLVLMVLITVRLALYGGYPLWDLGWIAEMVDRMFNAFSVLPPDMLIFVLVCVGWWRGLVASRREEDTQRTWFHFRVGVMLLVGYFLVTVFGGRTDMTALLFAFFFCGLMSIALSSLLEMGDVQHSALGSRQWVAVLAGSILGSLALALLASLLVSRQTLQTVLGWLRPIGRLVQYAAWYLMAAILYLIWPLIDWATAWLRQLQTEGFTVNISPLGSPAPNPLENADTGQGSALVPILRTAMTVLIVAGGLFLVLRAVRGLIRRQAERRELERESLWSGQDLAADLRNSLRQGWDRIKALAGQLGRRHQRSAATIRKMYASLVDLATEAGYPRRPAETPYEYLSILCQAFAGGDEAVAAITEAYVRVHYGQVPGSQAEMDRLRQYWEQVQRLVVPRIGEP
jgi:hypothetical protein